MQVRCFSGKVNETSDDEEISWLDEVRGRAIDVNLSLFFAAIKDVGFEACATGDVPYVHRLMRQEPRSFEKVAGNGDASLVVDVRLSHDSSVDLGEK